MAYSTGTSTGPSDLLDKLKLFLADQGWTVNQWATDGTGYRLHIYKIPSTGENTMYFNFRSAVDERGSTITEDNYDSEGAGNITGVLINGSTGYNSGNDWHDQPGRADSPDWGTGLSCAMCMTGMSTVAIPSYYFFTVGDSVHVVVEVESGHFQFMSFGLLVKQGVYTGGVYYSASYASRKPYTDWKDESISNYVPNYFAGMSYGDHHGAVYVDADSTASFRLADADNLPEILWGCPVSQRGNASYSQKGINSFFWSKAPNFYNNISAMCPIYTLLERSDGNYSLLGWPEGVRSINTSLYTIGQEVVYGTDTWKIFPELSFEDNSEIGNENLGFAFLKET